MAETTTPATAAAGSFEAALKAAIADIRSAGVKVRQNITTADVQPQALGLTEESEKTTPYLWTDGSQGCAYTFVDGLPYYRSEVARRQRRTLISSPLPSRAQVKVLFFNHGGPDLRAATLAAEAFRKHGLTVGWNGTAFDSVQVRTPFHGAAR